MGSERSEGMSGADFVLGKQRKGRAEDRRKSKEEPEARQTARARQVCKPLAGQFRGGHMGEQLKPNKAEVH